MTKIAIVGTGLVGASWSVVFARAGLDVCIYDPAPAAIDAAFEFAARTLKQLRADGLLDEAPERAMARLGRAATLGAAVGDADYIQESAPERLPIKQALHTELSAAARADAIVASSTSGFPASAFTEGLAGRERFLVAHPINPPHLVPLVEIVPAPWTAPDVIERTDRLMRDVGQAPIRLSREINGFIVNRLQSAILGEAFRLFEDGIASAADVDAAIAQGLGLRWAFIGPFETIDLNAPTGVAEYCRNLGPMYLDLAREQADPRPWSDELVAKVEKERRAALPAESLGARKAWRDRCLAELAKLKRGIAGRG